MVSCGFCAFEFEENRAQPACKACPVGSDCGLIRCPRCGYENPSTPGWIAALRRLFRPAPPPPEAPYRPSHSLPVLPVAGSTSGGRPT